VDAYIVFLSTKVESFYTTGIDGSICVGTFLTETHFTGIIPYGFSNTGGFITNPDISERKTIIDLSILITGTEILVTGRNGSVRKDRWEHKRMLTHKIFPFQALVILITIGPEFPGIRFKSEMWGLRGINNGQGRIVRKSKHSQSQILSAVIIHVRCVS